MADTVIPAVPEGGVRDWSPPRELVDGDESSWQSFTGN